MDRLAVTRFNKQTWKENIIYRNSTQNNGCIYNSPRRISSLICPDIIIFVIEMNNSLNQIEGFGLIKNHIVLDKKYNIYTDKNYNRFTYKSKYRIDRQEILKKNEVLVEILEMLLFLGSTHMKRGQGIQEVPEWIRKNKEFNFLKEIKKLFIDKYSEINSN